MNENSEVSEKENEEEPVAEDNCNNETKRKKRKKRRKKFDSSKTQQAIETKHEEDEEEEKEEEGKDIDEIEKIVKEVNKLLGEPLPGCSSQSTDNLQWIEQKSKEDILFVQHKHLNPYNELKRIFGSKTVQAEQKYDFNETYFIINYE